ncbi:hypothetical protein, partial [Rhizobium sp.]|uniref:hypothetical protein n=1 Tax=Rhizobium sp. TaxID=391 RepID=UPI0028A9439B
MYRSAHRWAPRSILTDLFDPRWWLSAGGTTKARAAPKKEETGDELATAPGQALGEKKYDGALGHLSDNSALGENGTTQEEDTA